MAHSSLRQHRKLFRLQSALGIKAPQAVGHLQHLWWAVEDCQSVPPSGLLPGWTEVDIAGEALWDGDPGGFVRALLAATLIHATAEGYVIHDYAHWCSDYIVTRWYRSGLIDKRSRPAAEALGRSQLDKLQTCRDTVMTPHDTVKSPSCHCHDTDDPTQPNPTQPITPLTPLESSKTSRNKFQPEWAHVKTRFPQSYDTPEVAEAWDAWAHQRAGKKKPLTERAVQLVVTKSKDWTRDVVIQAINESYENGWTGIFPPKSFAGGRGLHADKTAIRRPDAERESAIERFKKSRRYRDRSKSADQPLLGEAIHHPESVSDSQEP